MYTTLYLVLFIQSEGPDVFLQVLLIFGLVIQPGEFQADPIHKGAATVSHVSLSMRKINEMRGSVCLTD